MVICMRIKRLRVCTKKYTNMKIKIYIKRKVFQYMKLYEVLNNILIQCTLQF